MNEKIKRRNVRFESSPGSLGWICFGTTLLHEFTPSLPCLVIEESLGGCGIILHWDGKLNVGDRLIIKVDQLEPVKAEIRFINSILKHVFHIGLLYDQENIS